MQMMVASRKNFIAVLLLITFALKQKTIQVSFLLI